MPSPPAWLRLRHTRISYFADFAVYPAAIFCASVFLVLCAPRAQWLDTGAAVAAGLLGWSFLEYALHRFLLHGPQPFRGWHLEHHRRPRALIGIPTVLSAILLLLLVFLPTLALGNSWVATGLTLGVTIGYLGYAWTHYALHHWRANTAWLQRRERLHLLHHSGAGCEYGVTTSIWDLLFSSRSNS